MDIALSILCVAVGNIIAILFTQWLQKKRLNRTIGSLSKALEVLGKNLSDKSHDKTCNDNQ